MENKKTIKYLNTQAWYRAVKVVYVIFVIFCYIIAVTGIYMYISDTYDSRQAYQEKQDKISEGLKKIQRLQDEGYTTEQISETYRVGGRIITLSSE